MLTHPRPAPSPILAAALQSLAGSGAGRALLLPLLAACKLAQGVWEGLDGVQVEAHAGRIHTIALDGAAMVILSHPADLPDGWCWIPAASADLYRQSLGYAPLDISIEVGRIPNPRPALVKSGSRTCAQGWDPRLLALPATVIEALGIQKRVIMRAEYGGRLEPVRLSAKWRELAIMVIIMPCRLP